MKAKLVEYPSAFAGNFFVTDILAFFLLNLMSGFPRVPPRTVERLPLVASRGCTRRFTLTTWNRK